mmetsp:Transcript_11996/g.17883  ORF Transcript_11996/g.17883 Transcript_11996/m.17883 type:complete len:218 (+) Transcript_11996:869-1522(+)
MRKKVWIKPGVVHTRGMTNIKHLACGAYSSFAISSRGEVHSWGLNNYGQLALPLPKNATSSQFIYEPTKSESLSKLKIDSIFAAIHHTLALSSGKLYSFGRGTYGRLGRSDVNHSIDDAKPDPAIVNHLENIHVIDASAGMAVSGAIGSKAQEIFMWGIGTTSQLGKSSDDPFPDDELLPARVQLPNNSELYRYSPRSIAIGGAQVMILADENKKGR